MTSVDYIENEVAVKNYIREILECSTLSETLQWLADYKKMSTTVRTTQYDRWILAGAREHLKEKYATLVKEKLTTKPNKSLKGKTTI